MQRTPRERYKIALAGTSGTTLPDELSNQVKASAWIALGLTEEQLGHSLESLEAFSKAGAYSPSDMIHFFIGQAYLFLVDREAIPDVAKLALFRGIQHVEYRRGRAISQGNALTRSTCSAKPCPREALGRRESLQVPVQGGRIKRSLNEADPSGRIWSERQP